MSLFAKPIFHTAVRKRHDIAKGRVCEEDMEGQLMCGSSSKHSTPTAASSPTTNHHISIPFPSLPSPAPSLTDQVPNMPITTTSSYSAFQASKQPAPHVSRSVAAALKRHSFPRPDTYKRLTRLPACPPASKRQAGVPDVKAARPNRVHTRRRLRQRGQAAQSQIA
ncbi:hypothetical protein BKA80DRAFT_88874 [Phyllosticta citrichinensis]